jgi:hypothetical protein
MCESLEGRFMTQERETRARKEVFSEDTLPSEEVMKRKEGNLFPHSVTRTSDSEPMDGAS